MKRLRKFSEELPKNDEMLKQDAQLDVEGAKVAVRAINNSVDEIYDLYKKLFLQLNSLYEEYPSLYDEIKKIVRFPTEDDAQDIVNMKEDLEFISTHYEDTEYLSQIIDIFKDKVD
jgi:hypothetical protein